MKELGAFAMIGFVLLMIVGWFRHVIWTIMLLSSGDPVSGGQVGMAILGAILAPFGALHGVLLLFGFAG